MPQRRENPYIWTTSLPRLLTGECSCEYAAWFKAHHQAWTRQPSDFDAVQWQIEHTALLTETRDRFLASGYDVFTEAQNAFRFQGKTATLVGRPDLLVVNGDDGLIIDVKTGQERPSHIGQLMIYIYALPRALQQYRDARIRSEVFYPTHTHLVGRGSLDQGFIRRLVTLIQRVAALTLPPPPARQSAVSATSRPATAPTASTPMPRPPPATPPTSDVTVVNKHNTTRPRTSSLCTHEHNLRKE